MNELYSLRPFLAVLVSALASLAILFTRRSPNLRETWTFLAAIVKFLLILSLYPAVMQGNVMVFRFFELMPGLEASLRVDALGLYFGLLASGLWIITSVYSVGYMRTLKEHAQTRYFFSFALSLSATIGIAFAGDLVTFFIFYEMMTLATYPLVAHKENREAVLAGRKYLVYSLSAGACLLFAIAWTFSMTGSVQFTPGGFLGGLQSQKLVMVLFFLFVYGCGVKAALFPVHAWLPTAMVAPTPVSALLHAVAVVKAGVFGILRVTGYVFGPDLLQKTHAAAPLAWIAAFTILFASAIALTQDNLKRRLAYSTISQLSYIILGAALVQQTAFFGAVLHMANHALMKITLFFCAGVIYAKGHLEKISDMKGIGRVLPWTLAAFAVGALGLAGFPPVNGFVSKWFLCKGALQAGSLGFCAVYLITAFFNMAYFFPVLTTAFRRGPAHPHVHEKPGALVMPPVMTAVLALLFGMAPFFIRMQLGLAELVSRQVFGG